MNITWTYSDLKTQFQEAFCKKYINLNILFVRKFSEFISALIWKMSKIENVTWNMRNLETNGL